MVRFSLCFLLIFGAFATAEENELGINVGLDSIHNEKTIKLNDKTVGITYQHNQVDTRIKPRFDFDYVKVTDYQDKRVSSLARGSVNGVYEFDTESPFEPYLLMGVGYEKVNDEIKDVFDSRAFAQGGGGLNYRFKNGAKIKMEGKMLRVFAPKNQNHEVAVNAGVSFPLDFFGSDSKNPEKLVGVKRQLNIHFMPNSYELTAYSMQYVKKFALFLKKHNNLHARIEGNADSQEGTRGGMLISRQRAEAVGRKLVDLGIDSSRLKVTWRGSANPVASNANERGRLLNRRIEVLLTNP